ncbi:MAG: 2-dehydropantoate 2-reductase N-terminal domain-containing protein [Myxococcota bacterium]|nr:2-dehydropantoate 2-reductase N-terminal domain-containing protein [Myxococcota bacterium]
MKSLSEEKQPTSSRITIVGAGAVGLNLAARLTSSGTQVGVLTRRPDAASQLESEGIRLVDPAGNHEVVARISVTCNLEDAIGSGTDRWLICHRTGETESIARKLHAHAPDARIASVQNDVVNESILRRYFPQVTGVVLRQTCTLRQTNTVLATGSGRIIVGDYPSGWGPLSERWARDFEEAGFDVGRSSDIASDKWLKLVYNCLSAVNALIDREDHVTPSFVEIKVRLLEEARAALTAARIPCLSCDGRDRPIEAEIEHLRRTLLEGTSRRDLPLYNACWTALKEPSRTLEADLYHKRIIALAARHGQPAPSHRVILNAVCRAWTEKTGPEKLRAAVVLAQIDSTGA